MYIGLLHLLTTACSPDDKLFLDVFVDDEVEVSLAEPSLFVLETEMEAWQHVETGREKGDGLWYNTQLPLLRLGCRTQHTTNACRFQLTRFYLTTLQLCKLRNNLHNILSKSL